MIKLFFKFLLAMKKDKDDNMETTNSNAFLVIISFYYLSKLTQKNDTLSPSNGIKVWKENTAAWSLGILLLRLLLLN